MACNVRGRAAVRDAAMVRGVILSWQQWVAFATCGRCMTFGPWCDNARWAFPRGLLADDLRLVRAEKE
jgi:hypothetical protein